MGERFTQSPEQAEHQKREYFIRLGLEVREALKLHKAAGLWERRDGKRDWGGVSEHCLVEVARAGVLATKLGLSEDLRQDLTIAAALHDFFKKGEKEIVEREGLAWSSFETASEQSTRKMEEAGFSQRVVRLANAVGHGSLLETEAILEKTNLSPEDMAFLALHLIDDYTINADWVGQTEATAAGAKTNDLDRRVDKNEANERYSVLNEEGREYFNGETTFEAQRRIGHLVEQKLVDLIEEKTGGVIESESLPRSVDMEIQAKIAQI